MKTIVAQFILYKYQNECKAAKPSCQTGNVDESKCFVPDKTTKGGKQNVS
jgi:hypothetical protein